MHQNPMIGFAMKELVIKKPLRIYCKLVRDASQLIWKKFHDFAQS